MSIAVSVVIFPSHVLRLIRLGFGTANLGAAAALGFAASWPSSLAVAGAACCLLAGVLVLRSGALDSKVSRIDISGLGQLRQTVQQGIGSNNAPAVLVQLLPASTIWPGLLLLRLRGEDGAVRSLVLAADSIESGQFRQLSVAIRDIASRIEIDLGNSQKTLN
jgi:toxin CptA